MRAFNVFDGLFLLALYLKITHQGPAISWFDVFAPYVVEAIFVMLVLVARSLRWKERAAFFVWKIAVSFRVKMAGKKARNFIKKNYETGRKGNPGKFVDPANTGNQRP